MNFRNNWNTVDALFNIFGSDAVSPKETPLDAEVVKNIILKLFAETITGETGNHEEMSSEGQIALRQAISALKKAMPWIKGNSEGSALIWAHWAYNDATVNKCISRYFFRELLRFSTPLKTSELTLIQLQVEKEGKIKGAMKDQIWAGTRRKEPGFEDIYGTTLGRFFRHKKLTHGYKLQKLRLKKIIIQEQQEDRKKRKKAKLSRNRDQANYCGRTLLKVIEECIHVAAKAEDFLPLKVNCKVGDRYTCSEKRANLLSLLRTRFTQLQSYKDSTLTRALSSYVAFRVGRSPLPENVKRRESTAKAATVPRS
jgi:hypothetical protein